MFNWILEKISLYNCWNASLLNICIVILLIKLIIVVNLFFRRGLVKWIGEFFFNVYKVFITFYILIITIIIHLAISLHLKIEIPGLYIILSLKIIMNHGNIFQARTTIILNLILIFNNLLQQLYSLILIMSFTYIYPQFSIILLL